jgi:Flp pilus assembly protein TadG
MRLPIRWHEDERGLVGKVLVVWLLVLALVVVVAIDGGSILLGKIHARDLARTAADAGAATIAEGRSRDKALQAALRALGEADENALVERFEVSQSSVTVEVADEVGTILVGRFGLFEDLTVVSATVTTRLPER